MLPNFEEYTIFPEFTGIPRHQICIFKLGAVWHCIPNHRHAIPNQMLSLDKCICSISWDFNYCHALKTPCEYLKMYFFQHGWLIWSDIRAMAIPGTNNPYKYNRALNLCVAVILWYTPGAFTFGVWPLKKKKKLFHRITSGTYHFLDHLAICYEVWDLLRIIHAIIFNNHFI